VVALIEPVEVPPLFAKLTVAPPEEILLLFKSFALRVKVTALPEATEAELTVTTELAAEMAPAFTVTVGRVVVIKEPPMVARIVVAVPEATPVKVAE
jgi:hypothetical protein